MINEEIARKTLNMEVRAAKVTGKLILNLLKKLMKEAEKLGGLEKLVSSKGNEVKLKDMVKKGQLEEIPVEEAELKELKKELNRHGVKFSVMKDKETGKFSVFFQAKDMKVMDKAFKHALSESEKKTERKESIHKNIEKFKEMAKNSVSKDKIKNKQKEQSLCACGFPSFLSCKAMSAHIPTFTKFSFTYSRTSSICFPLFNSLGKAISISLASCEFLLFSIFSTLFHNIPLSKNFCGAFCGNRISVCAIPPFLVKSWTIPSYSFFIFSPLR